jgi:hypothetical protein
MFLLFGATAPAFAQRNAMEIKPTPMQREFTGTNSVHWHTITVAPKTGLPKIYFYGKLNPVWWLENSDEPAPPAWYLPGEKHRAIQWRFRNSFHNFNFYVIGIADRSFVRSGRYPERNSNPRGGWDFELVRRRLALLPFFSYEKPWCTFYFGWREHGAFGMEFCFHHEPSTNSPAKTAH